MRDTVLLRLALLPLLVCPTLGWDAAKRQVGRACLPLPTATLLDVHIEDRKGSCHLLLLRPLSLTARDVEACLHITLEGRGTRSIAVKATSAMGRALDSAGPCDVVVDMAKSRGAAVTSFPVIASFMMARHKQLKAIAILQARGLALSAVRIISRLSQRDLQHYRSLNTFAMASGWPSARHRLAVQAARRAKAAQHAAAAASAHPLRRRLHLYLRGAA